MKQIIAGLAVALAALTAPRIGQCEPMLLIDFEGRTAVAWSVVNDGVMGGVSSSDIAATSDGTGLFAGELSLENNGGFASVRATLNRRDLSGFAGLEVRLRGDGRSYQMRLRTDNRFDGIAYRAEFTTRADEWTTVRIPFAQFEPTFRGRILTDVPPLDTARIAQVGFLLADKQPGAFALEIESVQTWVAPGDSP